MHKGKIVGKTSSTKQSKSNNYLVIGELFEYPQLQCEKAFKLNLEHYGISFGLEENQKILILIRRKNDCF